MAGTFTHWMIVEDALEKYRRTRRNPKRFGAILAYNHFVNLGAVGPDYPYLTDLLSGVLKEHTWADRMHYENTGEFLKVGAAKLLQRDGDERDICLAWFCGFISHVVADAVVHPMVNAIVGPYIFNASEHRHCEMIQDVYIFNEIIRTELRYSNYVDLLRQCSDPSDEDRLSPVVRAFWAETLEASHPGGRAWFEHIRPDKWHEDFLARISSAAAPGPVFRHIREETNLAYKRVEDFDADERKRFIQEVRLPAGKVGRFREDVFDKAVAKLMVAWDLLFRGMRLRNMGDFSASIKNWNLDTGVDEDHIHFWS
jgi:hypothetical protein